MRRGASKDSRVGVLHNARMLVLSRREVERLLDLDALLEAVASAMADLSAGRASMPGRAAAEVEERSALLAVMPAYVPAAAALTTKLVSLFPLNEGTAIPTHQALIAAFDAADGRPVALLDGTHITAARTAAGSALSIRLLAGPTPPRSRSWAPASRRVPTPAPSSASAPSTRSGWPAAIPSGPWRWRQSWPRSSTGPWWPARPTRRRSTAPASSARALTRWSRSCAVTGSRRVPT
jgi:hypothetical protein